MMKMKKNEIDFVFVKVICYNTTITNSRCSYSTDN